MTSEFFWHSGGTPAVALPFAKWRRSDSTGAECSIRCPGVFERVYGSGGTRRAHRVDAIYSEKRPQSYRDGVPLRPMSGRIAIEQGSMLGWERCVARRPRSLHEGFGPLGAVLGVGAQIRFEPERMVNRARGDAAVKAVIQEEDAAADATRGGRAPHHGDFRRPHNPIITSNPAR
jgi:hypothetical protein